MSIEIRPIEPKDNPALQNIILETLVALSCFESEYLSNPDELKNLFNDYQARKCKYYVLSDTSSDSIYGGGGYAPLNGHPDVCEIQKMYIAPELRGQGFGKRLLSRLLIEAEHKGFDSFYIETMTNMTAAAALYKKFGFIEIPDRLGGTGHNCCSIFMVRNLAECKSKRANTTL